MPEINNPAVAATIARVLEQIGVGQPVRIDVRAGEGGEILARVILEQDVSELHCTLSAEGDLIAARLVEH